jgi:NAD(P)-dependent dehydrogenase (short-subunit alcohol dehydrogenase family)
MAMTSLQGKVAVVTGGSSGIGLATVELLLEAGAAVAFCGRDGARLKDAEAALRERYPQARLYSAPCDVLSQEQVQAFAASVENTLGAVSMLVNNAGQGRVSTLMREAPHRLKAQSNTPPTSTRARWATAQRPMAPTAVAIRPPVSSVRGARVGCGRSISAAGMRNSETAKIAVMPTTE